MNDKLIEVFKLINEKRPKENQFSDYRISGMARDVSDLLGLEKELEKTYHDGYKQGGFDEKANWFTGEKKVDFHLSTEIINDLDDWREEVVSDPAYYCKDCSQNIKSGQKCPLKRVGVLTPCSQ
jgi:hypothetical protein